ncbi:MAG: type I restriction endonuclease subunit M [Deltaproteobacteria bacterium]|nr:type I restriction endonuclease subunit M [Deltaproteobacteria bacterium]
MALASIQNRRGFFSDYWLGTLLSARGRDTTRLTAAQARRMIDRLRRLIDSVNGVEAPDLTGFREHFARPLLEEILGFVLRENAQEPRLRPLDVGDGENGSIIAVVHLLPENEALDAPRTRRALEGALEAWRVDYGFVLTPEVLRLVRRPGLGGRGAALDVHLAAMVEQDDTESLVVLHRLLLAQNFVPREDDKRPIDMLEAESRRHSAKVSEDLKQAVFEAAERIVGGFFADVRARAEAIAPPPSLAALREAGFLALYRLLFILYAEARDERLIQHRFYQKHYSLDGIVSRLLGAPIESLPANRHGLWAHLVALFRIFNEGIAPHLPDLDNIPPRGGRLFNEETPEGRLLSRLKLDDRSTAQVLRALATTRPRRGVGRERVSFRELDIEHLGNVYQGLLEYEPEEARETLIGCRVAGRELVFAPAELVRLVESKSLGVAGEAAIVEGTEAAAVHPDAALIDEHESEDDKDEDTEEESGTEGEETEKGVKRGATLKLTRRLEAGEFFFKPGSARKASGSYYTPGPIVDYLVREALAPLVEGKSAAEIERLRVIDLACGSAHFLVGAARFLGGRLFEAYRREGNGDPPPAFYPDRKLSAEVRARWEEEGPAWCKRRIVEHCLYGVDLNPAAVQLAQVALWIESLAGDRPLSFFAHHIRCGNSLLGSSLANYDRPPHPKLGKPSDRRTIGLFEAELKKRLEAALEERKLIDAPLPPEVRADTPEEYGYKEDRLRRAEAATETARLLLDLRSAAAFLPAIWSAFPTLMSSTDLEADARSQPWWEEFKKVRDRERFFHWELEFPEVFADLPGGQTGGGFDCVLGNPPWDKVLPSKIEFYGQHDVLIRAYKGNELDRRIDELHAQHPNLAAEFAVYRERATTIAQILRSGGDFPLAEARSQAAHEEIAKYFVDRAISVVATGGAVGLLVPSVFYNGDGWVGIRRYLVNEATIERFCGFENRKKIFNIHSSYKFVCLVARKDGANTGAFNAAFMRHDIEELENLDAKPWEVQMTREEIVRLSPETLAFLEYRSPRDQEIVRKMYAGRPTLGGAGGGSWGTRFVFWRSHELTFNTSEDKDLFCDPQTGKLYAPDWILGVEPTNPGEAIELMRAKGFRPVFEGKHVDQFLVGIKPIRWWLSVEQMRVKYNCLLRHEATLVFRDTARNTDERTCIANVLPSFSAASNTITGLILENVSVDAASVVLNSLSFDFALRLRTAGTHVSMTYIDPVPVPPADAVNRLPTVKTRLAWETGIDHITEDEALWPSLWEANRAVAQAYGLDADDLGYILSAFPVFARKRPKFFAYLKERVAEWKQTAASTTKAARIYSATTQERFASAAEGEHNYRPSSGERRTSRRTATRPFRQAATLAWLVYELYEPGFPVSRYRAGKMMYLVECSEKLGLFQNYLKYAAGPYDPGLRYRGPENIALNQRHWLVAPDSTHFEPGPNIQEAIRFAKRYIPVDRASAIIENFKEYTNPALERWTTVEMAARELQGRGETVTPENVLAYIESVPEWESKLQREEFRTDLIASTLSGLRKFGFILQQ